MKIPKILIYKNAFHLFIFNKKNKNTENNNFILPIDKVKIPYQFLYIKFLVQK